MAETTIEKNIPVRTASASVFLSLVMPAYNEGSKIEADLAKVRGYFQTREYPYEIIVVDDGSADDTSDKVLRQQQVGGGRIRLVRYSRNRGKGFAVKTGVAEADGRYILFADAGSCVPYDEVERGLALLEQGCDIAIGSRGMRESVLVVKQPLYRRLGSRVFGVIVRHLLGLQDIQDTQCGFKLFRREAAKELFGSQRTEGFMFDIEMLFAARRKGYRIVQFPVDWSNDPDSRFKPVSGSFRNLMELLRIVWHR